MTEYPAFPRIDGLVDLLCRGDVDVRPTLLRVLTDLYVQVPTHTPDDEAQYVELALRLIDSVDAPIREMIAARLADYPRAPRKVLDALGVRAAASTPAPQPDRDVAMPDLPNAFFAATSYERQMILTNLDTASKAAARPAPAAAIETCRRLEAAVLDGDIAEFTRLIESALSLPHRVAEKIVADPLGEPVVVAARALGMAGDALERVLLLLNPVVGRSVERVYALAALYREISAATAEQMVAIWRGRAPRRRGVHQPALYDDEQRSARADATPSRHPATGRRSAPLADRFRSSGR